MSRRAAIRAIGWLLGPLAWAMFFLVAYASESLVCSRAGAPALHGAIVAAAALAAMLAIFGGLWVRRSEAPGPATDFEHRVTAALHWLSLLAIGWAGLAALLLPACR